LIDFALRNPHSALICSLQHVACSLYNPYRDGAHIERRAMALAQALPQVPANVVEQDQAQVSDMSGIKKVTDDSGHYLKDKENER